MSASRKHEWLKGRSSTIFAPDLRCYTRMRTRKEGADPFFESIHTGLETMFFLFFFSIVTYRTVLRLASPESEAISFRVRHAPEGYITF